MAEIQEAPYGVRKDGSPRKKPGPPKGTRPSGRTKGTKNKRTIEREAQQRLDRERAELLAQAAAKGDEVKAALAAGKKLMKEIAFDFAELFAGMAAFYQPVPPMARGDDGRITCANPNYDEEKFRYYAALAKDTAIAAAPFQSPRYSAVMVGQTQVTRVIVEGGMPDEFARPGGEFVDLKATEIVSAEEPKPPALPKVVAG